MHPAQTFFGQFPGLAWLTARCEFPGRCWLDWALMLPLALPAYVLAFVTHGLFDAAGPVQRLLSHIPGTAKVSLEVRGTGWVIAVLTLAFYTYVYLLARTAFLGIGRGTLEAARLLGLGPWSHLLPRRPADCKAGDRGRRGAGADGDAGRLRRGERVQLRHLHDRHLQGLVRSVQPAGRRPARTSARRRVRISGFRDHRENGAGGN